MPDIRPLVLRISTIYTIPINKTKHGRIRSACTADDRPADYMVTPYLRELIRKMESLGNGYMVTAQIFRNGEAILAIAGYTFADGLPSGGDSLQNLHLIRRRFTVSLPPCAR